MCIASQAPEKKEPPTRLRIAELSAGQSGNLFHSPVEPLPIKRVESAGPSAVLLLYRPI